MPILALGGVGVISVLSNVAPRTVHDICAEYFAGNTAKAAELQIDWSDMVDALFCEVNPIPVKTAMGLMGCRVGNLRLPLTEMESAGLARLKEAMRAHGLLK